MLLKGGMGARPASGFGTADEADLGGRFARDRLFNQQQEGGDARQSFCKAYLWESKRDCCPGGSFLESLLEVILDFPLT